MSSETSRYAYRLGFRFATKECLTIDNGQDRRRDAAGSLHRIRGLQRARSSSRNYSHRHFGTKASRHLGTVRPDSCSPVATKHMFNESRPPWQFSLTPHLRARGCKEAALNQCAITIIRQNFSRYSRSPLTRGRVRDQLLVVAGGTWQQFRSNASFVVGGLESGRSKWSTIEHGGLCC